MQPEFASAAEYQIPYLSRQVFLDNEPNAAAIERRFEEVLELARNKGLAVAIGHPHASTLLYLQRVLPELESRGYRLALVSEVVQPSLRLTQLRAN